MYAETSQWKVMIASLQGWHTGYGVSKGGEQGQKPGLTDSKKEVDREEEQA